MKLLLSTYLVCIVAMCVNMGESKQTNTLREVRYRDLGDKEGCFHATIYDDKNVIKVRNFSFSGHTKIDGILKEDDDSVNAIDLATIKEIIIKAPFYESNRYQNQELLLASIKTKNSEIINDFLIPRQVQISGIEDSTQIQKAWYLSKIKSITVGSPCSSPEPQDNNGKKKDITQIARTESVVIPLGVRPLKEDTATVVETEVTQQIPQSIELTTESIKVQEQGFWASVTNLFDAIIGVFKAMYNAILSLFGSR